MLYLSEKANFFKSTKIASSKTTRIFLDKEKNVYSLGRAGAAAA